MRVKPKLPLRRIPIVGYKLTITEDGKWVLKVTNLPLYVQGVLQTYTWQEEIPAGYEIASFDESETGATITNLLPRGPLSIDKKVMVDAQDVTADFGGKTFYVKISGKLNGFTEIYYVKSISEEGTVTLSTSEADAGVFPINPGTTLTLQNLPVGVYTVTEVANTAGDALGMPDADMGSMTFVPTLSVLEDTAIVTYQQVMRGAGDEADTATIINTYVTGRFCVAVTKQWLVNGEASVPDDQTLTVKLQRKLSTETAEEAWQDVKVTLDGKKKQETVTLNKANNWTAVAVGMEQMDANGVRYDYRWIEVALDGWYEGIPETSQQVLINEGEHNEATLMVLTKLTNSRVNVEIPVQKIIEGSTFTGDEEFEVKLIEGENPQKIGQSGMTASAISLKLKQNEIKSFILNNISKTGDYSIILKETKGSTPGMTYDEAEHVVTFKVVADGDLQVLKVTDLRVSKKKPDERSPSTYTTGALTWKEGVRRQADSLRKSRGPNADGFTVALEHSGKPLSGTFGGYVFDEEGKTHVFLRDEEIIRIDQIPVGTEV